MFNFRFFSLGTNNQLHLLPIKVLMAHQSKKNHCKRSLHKLCTHVISLEVIFYFQKEIKSINYTLKALCTAPTTVLIVTLHLKLWGQALLLLKDLGASYLKCNNVALNAEASRTCSCFYGAWQKLITRLQKAREAQAWCKIDGISLLSLQVSVAPCAEKGTEATKGQTHHKTPNSILSVQKKHYHLQFIANSDMGKQCSCCSTAGLLEASVP